MTNPQSIIEAALTLSREDRMDLTEKLINSLDGDDACDWEPEIRDAWIAEAKRRWDEFQSGGVESIPAETVMASLRARFQR